MTVSSDGASSDGGFIEGAMTKMLVFKRLAAVAVVIGCTCRRAARRRSPRIGQATPWQFGLQDSATPIMDDIISFHDFLLYRDHRHLGIRARPC